MSDWSSDVFSSDLAASAGHSGPSTSVAYLGNVNRHAGKPRYNLHSDSGRRNDRGRNALREPAQTLRDVARIVPTGVFDLMLQGAGRFLLLGRIHVSESGHVPVAERKAPGISQHERSIAPTRHAAPVSHRQL